MSLEDALNNFIPREQDKWMFENTAYLQKLRIQLDSYYPSFVMPDHENPAMICGCMHELGVGEVWMITGQDFDKHVKTIVSQLRQLSGTLYRCLNLRLLYIRVESAREDAKRFAEAMGFEYSHTAPRMGFRGEDLDYYYYQPKELSK